MRATTLAFLFFFLSYSAFSQEEACVDGPKNQLEQFYKVNTFNGTTWESCKLPSFPDLADLATKAPEPPEMLVSENTFITDEDKKLCSLGSGWEPIQGQINDNEAVWKVGSNRWTLEHEQKYSEWVQKFVKADFFQKFNLATDCADAAGMIRTIFARIHHLPMVFTNGRDKIGHFSRNFKNLKTVPEWNESNWQNNLKADARFRRFLTEMTAYLGTGTFPLHVYPVRIRDPQDPKKKSGFVRPGTAISDRDHTRFISTMNPNSFLSINEMSSTSGVIVRELYSSSLGSIDNIVGRGLVNWRWPINCGGKGWMMRPASSMPGYSTEQYKIKDLDLEVMALEAPGIKFSAHTIQQKIQDFRVYASERIAAVNRAEDWKKNNPGKQIIGPLYEDLSTPNRDKSLERRYRELQSLVSRFENSTGYKFSSFEKEFAFQALEVGQGKRLSLWFIADINDEGSDDPNDSFGRRWGIENFVRTCSNINDLADSDSEKPLRRAACSVSKF